MSPSKKYKALLFILVSILALAYYGTVHLNYNKLYQSFEPHEQQYLRSNLLLTTNMRNLLIEIYKKNDMNINIHRPKAKSRHPRHVWHKSKAVMTEYNILSRKNNLAEIELPIQEQHIGPKQVHISLNKMAIEMNQLAKKFDVHNDVSLTVLPDKAIPTEIYNNLDEISQLIEGFDATLVKPQLVYVYAEMIVASLKDLQKTKGYSAPLEISIKNNLAPRDVYDHAYDLLINIQLLSQKTGFEVHGGIELLHHDKGHISPADVYNLLTNIYADVQAIRLAHSSKAIITDIDFSQHRTPSDVYNKLSEAHAIVELLL